MKLFEGEVLNFQEIAINPSQVSNAIIEEKYKKGEFKIVTDTARYPLTSIVNLLRETIENNNGIKEYRYKLDPTYQRRQRWSPERQSKLIESFLMNVPVPPIFLYEIDFAKYEVMDGRQRLNALKEFYENKLILTNLSYWPELNGKMYHQLPPAIKDGINRRYITSTIILNETALNDPEKAAILKKFIFERLNSGGVLLSPQETRNATYAGKLNDLCVNLSENIEFKKMWRIPLHPTELEEDVSDEEILTTDKGKKIFESMEDVELILRFFAYRQISNFTFGLNKINFLLDFFLQRGNKFDDSIITSYEQLFNKTINFLYNLLGENAFCKSKNGSKYSQPMKIIYDSLMWAASQFLNNSESIIKKKIVFTENLFRIYQTNDTIFNGRSTNSSAISERNKIIYQLFEETAK